MPFGLWTWVDPRKHVLDGGHIGASWRLRVTEPSVYDGDAALCQITLTTCLKFHVKQINFDGDGSEQFLFQAPLYDSYPIPKRIFTPPPKKKTDDPT